MTKNIWLFSGILLFPVSLLAANIVLLPSGKQSYFDDALKAGFEEKYRVFSGDHVQQVLSTVSSKTPADAPDWEKRVYHALMQQLQVKKLFRPYYESHPNTEKPQRFALVLQKYVLKNNVLDHKTERFSCQDSQADGYCRNDVFSQKISHLYSELIPQHQLAKSKKSLQLHKANSQLAVQKMQADHQIQIESEKQQLKHQIDREEQRLQHQKERNRLILKEKDLNQKQQQAELEIEVKQDIVDFFKAYKNTLGGILLLIFLPWLFTLLTHPWKSISRLWHCWMNKKQHLELRLHSNHPIISNRDTLYLLNGTEKLAIVPDIPKTLFGLWSSGVSKQFVSESPLLPNTAYEVCVESPHYQPYQQSHLLLRNTSLCEINLIPRRLLTLNWQQETAEDPRQMNPITSPLLLQTRQSSTHDWQNMDIVIDENRHIRLNNDNEYRIILNPEQEESWEIIEIQNPHILSANDDIESTVHCRYLPTMRFRLRTSQGEDLQQPLPLQIKEKGASEWLDLPQDNKLFYVCTHMCPNTEYTLSAPINQQTDLAKNCQKLPNFAIQETFVCGWIDIEKICALKPYSIFKPWLSTVPENGGELIDSKLIERFQNKLPEDYNMLNPDQYRMVFSNSANVCVNAAAGSGKSTTLVLRLLVLNKLLEIPLETMAIFSFTNASVNDFVKKMVQKFKKWGDTEITNEDARKVITTFHKRAYERFKQQTGSHSKIFIEETNDGSTGSKRENDLLFNTHVELFESNPNYRHQIMKMTPSKLDSGIEKTYTDYVVKDMCRQQTALIEAITAAFDLQDTDRSEDTQCPIIIDEKTYHFTAHYKKSIADKDVFIFFLPEDIQQARDTSLLEEFSRKHQRKWGIASASRRNLLFSYPPKRVVVRVFSQLKHLTDFLTICNDPHLIHKNLESDSPLFNIKVAGDITKNGKAVWQLLYDNCEFARQLGVNLNDLPEKADLALQNKEMDESDHAVAHALPIYYAKVKQKLTDDNKINYPEIFDTLSHSEEPVQRLQHILIDEFQDISPETVAWIQNALYQNYKNERQISLMCVGDDWQSIYGWRGACTSFITNFKQYFPAHPEASESQCINMGTNYRSVKGILDDGYVEIQKIPESARTEKMVTAHQGVSELYKIYANTWEEAWKKLNTKEETFILARTHQNLPNPDEINGLPIKKMTYHASKGLEAENCIMITNDKTSPAYPLRQLIYKVANLGNYNLMCAHEKNRLDYVAITRAKKRIVYVKDSP
jgi:hypothetical protein